ncbi:glycosyltransferase family 4 protein [Methylobacterium sp. 37f]|uniref:glycosyltransferase family 4 protein n=1 Tax=Methylobacterium sp. 37f TaxID=2817058 RepID=UPI001FFC83E0|nr:glycosyltransferase family 4 protein [Methylobacterium sp. 37f]MCK2056172.1 glycosyltransferase family 4 protein [Methylobacterium sp. 37f]
MNANQAIRSRNSDRSRPIAIIIGARAPYMHRLYERLGSELDRPLHVLACSAREAARQWELPDPKAYRFEVIPGLRWYRSAVSNLYINPYIVPRIITLRPSLIVVNDFAPTMLMAAATARLLAIPYGLRTDGVPDTDPGQRSWSHRTMRRLLVPKARFGLGASDGSLRLLEGYSLAAERLALAPLFPAWEPEGLEGTMQSDRDRPYDILFCGILNEEVKGARFFTEVVLACHARGRELRIRVAGDGPLRGEMQSRFAEAGVNAHFDGFVQQQGLNAIYASARLFLFPSRGDVWGVVIQEALQCGTAVLASPHSGSARELLDAYACGVIRPMTVDGWVAAALDLLDDPERRTNLRHLAAPALERFSLAAATDAYRKVLTDSPD